MASRVRSGGECRLARRRGQTPEELETPEGNPLDLQIAYLEESRRCAEAERRHPAIAWDVFKQWAYHPVGSERDELRISIGYHNETATSSIDMTRSFDDYREEWALKLTLRFVSTRPDAPRLAAVVENCDTPERLADFFKGVEDLPGLRMAMRYPYWQFQWVEE